jgi:hypothetical protein
MRLIIGEKLQEAQMKTRLLSVLQNNKKDSLTQDDLRSVFDLAGLTFSKDTVACCFIFLLKKG